METTRYIEDLPCPECGSLRSVPAGLKAHRYAKHGVPVSDPCNAKVRDEAQAVERLESLRLRAANCPGHRWEIISEDEHQCRRCGTVDLYGPMDGS